MFESGVSIAGNPELKRAADRAMAVLRLSAERLGAHLPAGKRPPAGMVANHLWAFSHGVVELFAWIAAMVLGFIVFRPIGLALLAYMFWSKRMSCNPLRTHRRIERTGATGNAAFDAYRAETLKRLEEERDAFLVFLEELRAAKDRAEFDQFMARRSEQAA